MIPREIEHPLGTFARLIGTEIGLPLGTLWARLHAFGGPGFVQAYGFFDLSTAEGAIELPVIETLVADMREPDRIALCAPPAGGEPVPLIEASFAEPHDAIWADGAHTAGRLCVLTSPEALEAYPSAFELLTNAWIAQLPLAIFAWDHGVGSRSQVPRPPRSKRKR